MRSQGMATPESKRELFDHVRAYWPDELRILANQCALPAVLTDPNDVEIYKEVEQRIGPENEWHQLAAWAFHQALDKFVRRKCSEASDVVRCKDVSFWSFDIQMNENLLDSSWDEERAIYEAMPLR